MPRPKLNISEEFLFDSYVVQRKSGVEIAKELGCDHKVVYRSLRTYGFRARSLNEAHTIYAPEREFLVQEYVTSGKTIYQMAEEMGCSVSSMYRLLVDADIEIRVTDRSGSNNPMYGRKGQLAPAYKDPKDRIGTLHRLVRDCAEYKDWRKAVFERDRYTCICGFDKGGIIQAHHITPFARIIKDNHIKSLDEALRCEELWDVANGVTLCEPCHKQRS